MLSRASEITTMVARLILGSAVVVERRLASSNSGTQSNFLSLSPICVRRKRANCARDGDLVETRGSNLELMGGKAKHLVLLGPCGGQVGEAGNAHAMWKSTVNRRFDEIRCEERKRDRHVDLADAAPLAFGNSFGGGRNVSCEFIEPTASASN